jgi:transcription-repair coupling factor (superfamily II helicase)
VRLKRLHPKATYKEVTKTVSVPRPTEGAAGGRMGAPALRDEDLLDWCAKLLTQLTKQPAPVA